MKKLFRTLLIVFLALLLGLELTVVSLFLLPSQFEKTWLGEMADKYQLLRTTDGPKIVVIGGSSVAFGLDSAMLEEYTGMSVVNFGLYGALGTKTMLDLTRGHIEAGDIVVVAPEMDAQTLSLYFNGETMWQCCDSDYTMLLKIRPDNWGAMAGAFWDYALKKLDFYRNGAPNPEGVYNHASFNRYGDVIYSRPEPALEEGYDPHAPITLSPEILSAEFFDYLNEYTAWAESKGATVYFSYPPMNALAVGQDHESILRFATSLRKALDCRIISNLDDYILDPGYFYDSNYHLNDAGVTVRTVRLIQDLRNASGDPTPVPAELPSPPRDFSPSGAAGAPSAPPPPSASTAEPPENGLFAPSAALEGANRDAALFTYEPYADGLKTTGVTAQGLYAAELEVPYDYNGTPVLAVGEGTFLACTQLQTVLIHENIQRIYNDAFSDCASLRALYLDCEAQNILVAAEGLFDGLPAAFRVYVSRENYGSYVADYFWSNYIGVIEKMEVDKAPVF